LIKKQLSTCALFPDLNRVFRGVGHNIVFQNVFCLESEECPLQHLSCFMGSVVQCFKIADTLLIPFYGVPQCLLLCPSHLLYMQYFW